MARFELDQNIDREALCAVTGKTVFTCDVFALGLLALFNRFDFAGIIGRERRIEVGVGPVGTGFGMRGVDILLRLIHFCTVVADVTIDVDGS